VSIFLRSAVFAIFAMLLLDQYCPAERV